MEFEWDPEKSKLNQTKHGVSLKNAMEIWQGSHLTVENIAKSKEGETRSATIGLIGSEIFTAIWTQRNGKTRLISVRRARDGEKEIFKKRI